MTAIQQSLVTGHQSQNRTEGETLQTGIQAINSGAGESGSSVNISWQAVMRLSAFEQQRMRKQDEVVSEPDILVKEISSPDNNRLAEATLFETSKSEPDSHANHDTGSIPVTIEGMLQEIEQNLVQTSEPGYKHLRNLLNNQSDSLSEPEQLQEIVRKEKFFLGRRKAFMESSEFQSYSQVLNQFSNIIQRELTV